MAVLTLRVRNMSAGIRRHLSSSEIYGRAILVRASIARRSAVALTLLTAACLLVLFAGQLEPVWATTDRVEEAFNQYKRGEFLTAANLLRDLSQEGNTEAQYILGDMLAFWRGVPEIGNSGWLARFLPNEDAVKLRLSARRMGFGLLTQAAESGNAPALFSLGSYYRNDFDKYLEYMGAASQRALPEADYDLAWFYINTGVGLKSEDKSVSGRVRRSSQLFERAFRAGHIPSALTLGKLYLSGMLGEHDKSRALDLFHWAAERGSSDALRLLSNAHAKGDITGKDDVEAYKWMLLALKTFQSSNPQMLDEIGKKLGKPEIQLATSRANEWWEANARNTQFGLGKAVSWCEKTRSQDTACAKTALQAHRLCSYLILRKKLMADYFRSEAYNRCREDLIRRMSVPR